MIIVNLVESSSIRVYEKRGLGGGLEQFKIIIIYIYVNIDVDFK